MAHITALAGNFVMKREEEDDPGIGAALCGDPAHSSLATGRGVNTTQCWNTAIRDAIPIIWEGVGVQTKMVLLTITPGDSQQELGTMFGISGRWHRRQVDKLLAQRQVIPTKSTSKEYQ